MKKVLALLMVAGMFSLVACGSEETPVNEETAVTEETTTIEESTEEVVEEGVLLAVHECDATCEENGCTGPRCGEEGHECSDACHASVDAEEGHDHAEGEEHSEDHAH